MWMQSNLYYDAVTGEPQLIRSIRRALTRDLISHRDFRSLKYYEGWLSAVGTAGLYLYGKVPVLGALYACMFRSGKRRKPIQLEQYSWAGDAWAGEELSSLIKGGLETNPSMSAAAYKRVLSWRGVPTPSMRADVWEVEDMSPAEQISWERYFDSQTLTWSIPCEGGDGPRLWQAPMVFGRP